MERSLPWLPLMCVSLLFHLQISDNKKKASHRRKRTIKPDENVHKRTSVVAMIFERVILIFYWKFGLTYRPFCAVFGHFGWMLSLVVSHSRAFRDKQENDGRM